MYKIIGADGNQYGPVSLEELKSWVRDRRANGETMAQGPGMSDWRPLRDFPEFGDVLSAVSPAPGASVPAAGGVAAPNVAQMVSGPATGLLIVGILVALGNLLGIFGNLMGFAMPMQQSTGDPQFDKLMQMMSGTVGIISGVIGILLGGVTAFASMQMRKLQSYGLVMTMLILNMIPCCNSCCCLIGLPIGIWGLVVLMKPEVKSAFH